MRMYDFSPNILANTAITALKNAYEECSDIPAKESIMIAFKAIIQLHHELGKSYSCDIKSENDSDYDPSEYCAAV